VAVGVPRSPGCVTQTPRPWVRKLVDHEVRRLSAGLDLNGSIEGSMPTARSLTSKSI
jgi:hypothetical protein